MIAGMPVATAGNHHAITMDAATILRRLQRHRHFRPGRKGSRASEFYAVLGNDYGIGGQG